MDPEETETRNDCAVGDQQSYRLTDRPAKSIENRVEFQLRGRQGKTTRRILSPLAEAWDSEEPPFL
jgi:hypothetical protein